MITELLFVARAWKTVEQGEKFYQAVIGLTGFPNPRVYKKLHRKFKTRTAAERYGEKVLAKMKAQMDLSQPRAKKAARFS